MFRNRIALAFVFAAGAACSAARATEFDMPRTQFHNPRYFAMGGAFTAVSDDRNLFFTNPAGLAYTKRREIGFEFLPLGVNTNTIEVVNFATDHSDEIDNLNNMSDQEQAEFFDLVLSEIGGDRAQAQAHFPLWVLAPAAEGSRMPSLGFGFFARGYSEFLALPGASGVPTATYNLSQQYTGIGTAAYSWDNLLPGKLSAGASLKVDNQRLSFASGSMLQVSDNDNEVDFLSATVWGFDVGAMYEINQNFRVGASLFDMVSGDFTFDGDDDPEPFDVLFNGDVGNVEPAFVLGGAFKTDTWYGPLQGLLVSVDIAEPFDEEDAFWKNVYMGAESKLSFITTRFGFFQGYPGGGIGMGPLQYAFFASEAGNYPGARSNYQHALSFAFAFGL